jgi:hypothetical protein
MEKIEVFTYAWTYWDGQTDSEATNHSTFKVTREFVADREKNNLLKVRYHIIPESAELVDSDTVVEGRYHPELRRGFQTQVGH